MHCNAMQNTAVQRVTVQCNAPRSNAKQRNAPRCKHIFPQTALGWWGPGGVGRGQSLWAATVAECLSRFHCIFIVFHELELATLQPFARESLECCKIQWFWQLFGPRPFPGLWTAPEPHKSPRELPEASSRPLWELPETSQKP